jgi:hypothetical protein
LAERAPPRAPPRSPEQVGEQVGGVAEVLVTGCRVIAPGPAGVGVLAIIALLRALGTGGVDLAAVEAGALFRVAQQVVGGRDILELVRRLGVARVEVRMELLGELAVSLVNLVLGRALGNAQDLVGVFAHAPAPS